MSLLHWRPERVELIRAKVRENDKDIMREIEKAYSETRRPIDPPTFAAYRAAAPSDLLDEAEALLIRMLIDNHAIGDHINKMIWAFGKIAPLRHGLLTSDAPVMMSNGLGRPEGFLILPTSPSTYFLAANRPEVIDAFRFNAEKGRMERALNDAVVKQAENAFFAQADTSKADPNKIAAISITISPA